MGFEWKDIVEGSTGTRGWDHERDYSTVIIKRYIYAKTSKGIFNLGNFVVKNPQEGENFQWGGHNLYVDFGDGFRAYLRVDSNSYSDNFSVVVDSGQL